MAWRKVGIALGLGLVLATSAACRCGYPARGCRFKAETSYVVRNLSDENPKVRKAAATALRTNQGVPASAIDPLIAAIMSERHKDVHGEMLITLGHSGDERALEHIRVTLAIKDSAAREYGRAALKAWQIANGQGRM
jgi:hypothetical protein